MYNEAPIKLKIPRQDMDTFSLFSLTPGAASTWVENLPVTNTRLVVQLLQQAVGDLNRVELTAEVRFSILEVLRPILHVALSNLARGFLNQPLIMAPEARQLATMAESLYGLASTAYTIVAVHAIQQRDALSSVNPARLVCESIYRALTLTGLKILHIFQLYQPVAAKNWHTLHQLYTLAERQQLAKLPVIDKLSGGGSITASYLQTLLLGCCKPNQLRQTDLAAIYRGLHSWAKLVSMGTQQSGSDLFLVDLNGEQPAIYSSAPPLSMNADCRFINTVDLVEHLGKLSAQGKRDSKRVIGFDDNTNIPSNIIEHVMSSLGVASTRSFSRAVSSNTMWMSVGLSSTHYHVANGRTFEQVLFGDKVVADGTGNPFIQSSSEDNKPPQHGVESDEASPVELSLRERYPIFPVRMVNASPGGYCLEWSKELPREIKTGNIASIREPGGDAWVIAVIRWISQLEDAKTLVGVELLSPRGEPYGATVHKTTGSGTDPMRALLLPEIQLVGQTHTLVTPRTGFKEQQKVTLTRNGEEFLIQLQRQITVTGDFSQFNFRFIKQLEEVFAEDKSGPLNSVYDSVWSNI